MARGGPPHAQPIHGARIRDHALLSRGKHRLTSRFGASCSGVPRKLFAFWIISASGTHQKENLSGRLGTPTPLVGSLCFEIRPVDTSISGEVTWALFRRKSPVSDGAIRGLTVQYSSSMSAWCGRSVAD